MSETPSRAPRRTLFSDLRSPDEGRKQSLVLHVIGLTLAVAGVGMLVSAGVEVLDGGSDAVALLGAGALTAALGLTLRLLTEVPAKIASLDVFVTVTSAWVALAIFGAIPYVLTGTLPAIDDAIFESVAGFTTTGSTVLRPIEDASAGVLFWRAITQWLGGMGVIVLVVAVLPAVGSGGMDLLAAEAPGPTGERLTPRVTQTAQRLWAVYLGFTVLLALAYGLAGMSLYDAVAHSFTTVSTGGFSTYNTSLAHFESDVIEWIAIVAMFWAGTSFTLLYKVLRGSPGPLLRSIEFRFYLIVVAIATVLVFVTAEGVARDADGFRSALFAVMAIISTTGYATADFGQWGQASQALLLVLLPVGAMAGSTAGGVKIIRVVAIASHAHRESLRHLHPRLIRPVRIGEVVLNDQVANKVLGFFVLALAAFGGGGVLIALTGSDIVTAFSASATLLGNVGPGLGDVGPTEDFLNISRYARWIGVVIMLLGRLEIYPILLALVALPLNRPRRILSAVFNRRTS